MSRYSRILCPSVFALALLVSGSAGAALIAVTSDNTEWTEIAYPIATTPDAPNDHQTGIAEGDIVGNNTGDPAVLTNFDDNGTPGILTDGYVAFRVRLGEDKPPAGFTAFFGVGMDANTDGVIDLFLAVDNSPSGGGNKIAIFSPGAGANTSPSTTSIITTPLVSYAENNPLYDNYDFSPVTTIDPLETNTDLDSGGKVDYYLTFVVPFDDIVAQLGILGITFDENSTVQYVFGTSTQTNALNQDLAGPTGGTTSTLTWEQLGAISLEYTASGSPVPEPSTALLLGMGLMSLAAARRLA
ncbi:MAG TPA: PEP-CTERM sorting domain-containing protein [Myxococcota bacterium]